MNTPPNMTDEEVLEKINLVVGRIAPRYTFNGYEVDDIKQEAFIICMEALKRYDCKRPLENFLSVNLSNRLKNFIRDNYFTKNETEKQKVLNPAQLAFEDSIPGDYVQDEEDIIDAQDISVIIDEHLPVDCRSDYLKMISDVYVPKKRKEEVVQTIQLILEEHGYENR
jgi:RNA polymerase sigma factor (sigma-70 family)